MLEKDYSQLNKTQIITDTYETDRSSSSLAALR